VLGYMRTYGSRKRHCHIGVAFTSSCGVNSGGFRTASCISMLSDMEQARLELHDFSPVWNRNFKYISVSKEGLKDYKVI
jgi:hypothetical protein